MTAAANADYGRAADVTVDGQGTVTQITESGGDGHRSGASESACEWHSTPFGGTPMNLPPSFYGESPGPDYDLYVIWCGTDYMGTQWLNPGQTPGPEAFAHELIRRLTVNPSGVNVRPDNRGVTGIPSMFWVEGYDANALTATESAFGLTVTVTIQLVDVAWDFGDRSPVLHTGLGEAWPQRSSVQHNYRDSSGGSPFRVTATLLFQPTYTVNGVAGPALDPIQVPVTRDYVVHQIQAQRTR
jgi:hypothetical protein